MNINNKINNKKVLTLLKLAVGVGLLLFVIFKTGLNELAQILSELSFLSFFIILAHVFFQILFSSYNIKLLADALQYHVPYGALFKSYVPAWGLGKFLPEGIGELSIAYSLKKSGASAGDALFIAVFDKILTVVSLVIITLLGVWLVFPLYTSFVISLYLVLLLALLALPFISKKIRFALKKHILRRYTAKFAGFMQNFRRLLSTGKKYILRNLFVTFVKSLFSAGAVALIFLTLGIEVNPFWVLLINTLVVIVSMIPITIAGLGTREATAAYLYALVGVNASAAVGIYLLMRIVMMLAAAVFVLGFPMRKKDGQVP